MRMRPFVVLAVRATEKEQNRLSVFGHNYLVGGTNGNKFIGDGCGEAAGACGKPTIFSPHRVANSGVIPPGGINGLLVTQMVISGEDSRTIFAKSSLFVARAWNNATTRLSSLRPIIMTPQGLPLPLSNVSPIMFLAVNGGFNDSIISDAISSLLSPLI